MGMGHERRVDQARVRRWSLRLVSRFQTAFGATACVALVGDLLRETTSEAVLSWHTAAGKAAV